MKPFKRILVPTDFSDGAHVALDHALDLRHRFGARLTLLHVYSLPVTYPEGYSFAAELIAELEASARAELNKERSRAEARAGELGDAQLPPIETKLLVGGPGVTIPEVAKAGGYDLIVMGTHGRTGLQHLLIGSVAERVVRTAPCAVLTTR